MAVSTGVNQKIAAINTQLSGGTSQAINLLL